MINMRNQKGFGLISTIIILAFVAVVGVAVYNKIKQTNADEAASQTIDHAKNNVDKANEASNKAKEAIEETTEVLNEINEN